jgi:prepilin peptidase CpaA
LPDLRIFDLEGTMLESPLILIFPLAMAFAAAMDFFTMTIPNRISILLVASFAIVAVVVAPPWAVINKHLIIAAVVFVAAITMFALGWLGGGDAKLLSAASLWIGPDLFLSYIVYVTMIGGLLALALLRYRDVTVLPAWVGRQPWALRLHEQNGGIPYGVALGASAMLLYPETVWFAGLAL